MFCPKCGMENAEGASFCAACGSSMNPAPVEETAPVYAEAAEPVSAPVAEEAPKKDILAPVRPLLEKVTPFVQKNKLFVVGGAGIIVCVICIALLIAILGGGSGYDAYKHSIEVDIEDGEVMIIYDNKKPKASGLDSEGIDGTQSSIDGSILVLLTEEGDLAVVKGTKLTKIDDEVEYFVLSSDGTGVAYVTENDDGDDTLNLYNVKNKKTKTVTKYLSSTNIALSPNGDSVCYYEQKEDDDEASLMYFKGSKSTKVTSSEVYLLGLSNNGKYIYVGGEDDEGTSYLYSYNTKGDRNKIGKISAYTVFFNEDHTQIAYFNSDDGTKTYISTKAKEGVKIASSSAYPVIPGNVGVYSNRYSITVPTSTLFNKVYQCDGDEGYNIWYIRKNTDRSVKLEGGVSGITLSQDGKLVYYIDGDELKVLTVSKGDNAADKAKVLAEDIDDYIVTSDSKKVYYSCDDGVFCVNGKTGKGKKTVTTEEIDSSLYINAKDVVYYILDDDAYATKNGSKGKKVVSDANYLSQTANGVVYVYTDDAVYATKGAKKPAKIYEND